MDQVTKLVNDLVNQTETVLNRGLDNIYITTAIKVFLGLYAGFAAPKLPPSILILLDNIIVRVAVAFTIVLVATRDPSIALMISVAFIITLQTANKHRLINTTLSVADPGQVSWLPSAKKSPISSENFGATDAGATAAADEKALAKMAEMGMQAEAFLPFHAGVEQFDAAQLAGSKPIDNFHSPEPQFTSASQFESAQENMVPDSDQDTCVSTFSNQHCTQGLSNNSPIGAN